MSLRRRLAWMAISQSCFFFTQFIASVLLARLLTPYEMGVYAVAVAVSSILSILQAAGLNGFVVREPVLTAELLDTAFTINTLISIGLALIIGIVGVAGGVFLHEAGVRHVLLALAILPIIGIFEFLPASNIERAANFKAIALIGSGKILIAQGLSVVLAMSGFSYMSIAFGQVAGALFSATAFCIFGWHYVVFRFRISQYRRVAKFGLQMLAISGVNNLGTRLSDILLGRIVNLSALGLYGRAASLNSLIQQNIYMVIVRVLFVDIAEKVRAGEPLRLTYLTTIEILTAVLWPAFAGLAILSGPFIYILYGSRWLLAATPLVMLSISSMILAIISLSWELFVVRQETTRQTRIEFISTAINVGLFAVGCNFNLSTAAAARVLSAICTVLIYYPHLNRMAGTRTRDFLPIYLRSFMLTTVAVGPAGFVMSFNHWSASAPLSQIGPSIVLGFILWVKMLFVIKNPLSIEVVKIQLLFKNRIVRKC